MEKNSFAQVVILTGISEASLQNKVKTDFFINSTFVVTSWACQRFRTWNVMLNKERDKRLKFGAINPDKNTRNFQLYL